MMRALLGLLLLFGCADDSPADGPYVWDLPDGFPMPKVPEDNPMSTAKVELGRRLFYDTRLSENQTQSCASCHRQELAFTDGLARAKGSTGQIHPRGSMGLSNIAYAGSFTWGNPLIADLEAQALGPMFGESPIVELGLSGKEDLLLERLRSDPDYRSRFERSFPEDADPITIKNITRAIAAFERTMISGNAPVDRFMRGDIGAMSDSAQRGMQIFFDPSGEAEGTTNNVECFHCHGGFSYSASVDRAGLIEPEAVFFNTGLYNVDGRGAYPEGNEGLAEHTQTSSDEGRFKPPGLRNIAVTAPFMHDGSIATLEEVIAHYARGGRLVEDGDNTGDGRENPNRNIFIHGFTLSEQQQADLLAFLVEGLTDDDFLTDPRFSDPF